MYSYDLSGLCVRYVGQMPHVCTYVHGACANVGVQVHRAWVHTSVHVCVLPTHTITTANFIEHFSNQNCKRRSQNGIGVCVYASRSHQ